MPWERSARFKKPVAAYGLVERLHNKHLDAPRSRIKEEPPKPRPPPIEDRPHDAKRLIESDIQQEVSRLRSMVAFGESQRQKLLVDYMKIMSENNVLRKVRNEKSGTDVASKHQERALRLRYAKCERRKNHKRIS